MAATCAGPDPQPVAQRNPKPTPSDVKAALPAALPILAEDRPVHLPGLHNVVAFAEDLYSGGAPAGAAGFESLSRLGIRTIISVDGAQPSVEEAKTRGMRYVHLPIGYNGMSRSRILEIARAVRDLPGPVYIHCHHGKHRSASAAGAAAVVLGYVSNDEATARMRVSGTSSEYVGLYRCVALAERAGDRELLAADDTFPERWRTTGLVQSMFEIDEVFEHLVAIRAAHWGTPPDHPDLVPVAEAARLADLFRDLANGEEARLKGVEFAQWMMEASARATDLEADLAADPPAANMLDRRLAFIRTSCKDCHAKYRND